MALNRLPSAAGSTKPIAGPRTNAGAGAAAPGGFAATGNPAGPAMSLACRVVRFRRRRESIEISIRFANSGRSCVLAFDRTAPAARVARAAAAAVGTHELDAVVGPGEDGLVAVLETATKLISAGRHFRQREQRTKARIDGVGGVEMRARVGDVLARPVLIDLRGIGGAARDILQQDEAAGVFGIGDDPRAQHPAFEMHRGANIDDDVVLDDAPVDALKPTLDIGASLPPEQLVEVLAVEHRRFALLTQAFDHLPLAGEVVDGAAEML